MASCSIVPYLLGMVYIFSRMGVACTIWNHGMKRSKFVLTICEEWFSGFSVRYVFALSSLC